MTHYGMLKYITMHVVLRTYFSKKLYIEGIFRYVWTIGHARFQNTASEVLSTRVTLYGATFSTVYNIIYSF